MARRKMRLPRRGEEFLRTARGSSCRSALTLFHRWLSERSLELSDLTPTHLDQFWEQQQARNIAFSTLHVRKCRIHRYLYWLHGKGELRFSVDPPRLRHMHTPLCKLARQFLARTQSRGDEPLVRNFHDWLQRKHIALAELTPAHIETFCKQPISGRISRHSRIKLRSRLNPYLQWLRERGLVADCFANLLYKPFPLPDSAQAFVETLRPVRRDGTCRGYSGDLRDLHAWMAAQDLTLDTLDRHSMERWMKALADRGLAPVTRGARIIHARSYLRWLEESGVITADPDLLLRPTDMPKVPTCLPRPFPVAADRELQRRFLDNGSDLGLGLFLMRRTGVRIGELVRFERRCLEEDLHGHVFIKVPLGKLYNERLVPLDDEARRVAERLQRLCPQGVPFLLQPEVERDTLKIRLQRELKVFASGLDIPGAVVSHRLRHTYATELLNAGMSLIGLMKLLGHRSIRMTMRYAAITQDTVVRDYYLAMTKISSQYQLPLPSTTGDDPNPDRMLRDLVSFLRNHAGGDHRAHRLISRVHKLRYEIAQLQPAPSEP